MSNILQPFTQLIPSLSESEKHVLYYLDSMPSAHYKDLSLIKLANETNVSTTTVIRMCQKLQLSGFSELKFNLLQSVVPIDNQQVPHIIADTVNQLITPLALDQYETAGHMIVDAKRIFVVGVGLSKVNAEYFSKLLMQTGKETSYIYESHILTLLPASLQSDDLVVLISASGHTQTIISIASQLHYKNIKTLAITNKIDTPLHKLASFSCSTSIPEHMYNGFDVSARSLIMFILDLIFNAYIEIQAVE